MDAMLLIIALSAACAVSMVAFQIYNLRVLAHRLVSSRLSGESSGGVLASSSVLRADRAARLPLLDLLPASASARERTSRELARSGWAIRVDEYLALRLASASAGGVLGFVLMGRLGVDVLLVKVVGLIVLISLGWLAPRILLTRQIQRRRKQIEKQLPD